jgi:hypothetical protein
MAAKDKQPLGPPMTPGNMREGLAVNGQRIAAISMPSDKYRLSV